MRKLTFAIALFVLPVVASQARATQIIGSSTGLSNPVTTITFDEYVPADYTVITTQYIGLGVTFAPSIYYSPMSGFGNLLGHDVANFNDHNNFVSPLTLNFRAVENGVAFSIDGDSTDFTFTALLNGVGVDSFTANIGVSTNDYYGFANEKFDAISITQSAAGAPYYLIDNLQLAATPEPSSIALLGTGLLGLAGLVRRRHARVQQ